MRILHLLKSTSYSGAENVVISIMKNCTKHEMIYASPDGPIKERVQSEGFVFYAIEQMNGKGIKKVIEDVQPDIIHAHDFAMSTHAAWAAKGIPVISHLHNNPLWIKKLHPKTLLYLWSTRKYKKILTVSDAIEREFLFSEWFASKIEVLGNVVDASVVREKAEEPYGGPQYDIIFLGRLSSQKSPIYFCKIIEKLREVCPGIRVAMVGNGELEEDVENYIDSHNLENIIEKLGFQENPYPYLKNSKLLVMPSAWEGFGLVAVEAMILGKPVVCSGAGGLKNIVTEECGAICTGTKEYVAVIKRLLEEEDFYEKASEAACRRAEEFSDYEAYMECLYDVYDSCVKKQN